MILIRFSSQLQLQQQSQQSCVYFGNKTNYHLGRWIVDERGNSRDSMLNECPSTIANLGNLATYFCEQNMTTKSRNPKPIIPMHYEANCRGFENEIDVKKLIRKLNETVLLFVGDSIMQQM